MTALHRLAALVVLLMAGASAVGLLAAGVYRDNALVASGWRGNDLVTLVVAVPVTVLALRASRRGSESGLLVLMGMLLYAFYAYLFYLFGAAFNALFPVYVALVTASGAALAVALRNVDPPRLAHGRGTPRTRRWVAGWMLSVATALGLFWLAPSVSFLTGGPPPPMVPATGHVTNVTGALDLSLVVTLGAVGGLLLWRGRPWGVVLGAVWSVKGAVYMPALSAAAVTAHRAGATDDMVQVALWGPIGLGCLVASGLLLVPRRAPN